MSINLSVFTHFHQRFIISFIALTYAESVFIYVVVIGTVDCFYAEPLIHVKLALMCIMRGGFDCFLLLPFKVIKVIKPLVE